GVMRRNALVKAVAVVAGVFLRFSLTTELSYTPSYFSTVTDGRPVPPIETLAHSEIGREAVVHTELDGSGIQQPGLITGWVASDVVVEACPIWMNHQGSHPGSHGAEQLGWNLVARSAGRLGTKTGSWGEIRSDGIPRAVAHERIARRSSCH